MNFRFSEVQRHLHPTNTKRPIHVLERVEIEATFYKRDCNICVTWQKSIAGLAQVKTRIEENGRGEERRGEEKREVRGEIDCFI